MADSTQTLERNREIARDFIDALSSGDADRILGCYAKDATVWTAGALPFSGLHTTSEVPALCAGLLGAFPEGLRFTIKALTAEGERVAIEAESRGHHISGQEYHQRYHILIVIRSGKIVHMKEYFDTELARAVLMAPPA